VFEGALPLGGLNIPSKVCTYCVYISDCLCYIYWRHLSTVK